VAALGTYLLTNMLAQSAAFGLEGSITHQSALATLAAYANLPPTESSLRRSTIPFNCGIEMQQVSQLHLSPNIFHGISIPQNQNNNESQQRMEISSEETRLNTTRTSSTHI
jgi:hypothetical protein